jgi:RNA polymerase sigma-70 factor, ECF subfamily
VPVTATDAQLLAAHRDGDARAFDELVGRHRQRMWSLALRTLRHPEDAADAVQDALLAAYRRADTYRGEAPVHTWLFRIVVNTCIDRIRRDRLRVEVPLGEEHAPARAGDLATEVVTRLSLVQALALLPLEQRLPIVLVDQQGWSVADAAAILGVPTGTVKSRCARGRTRLAVLLGHLREEEA